MGMARRSLWVQWRQSAILLEVVWGDRVNADNGRGQSDMVWESVWGMVGVSMGWRLGQAGEMTVVKEVWRQKWNRMSLAWALAPPPKVLIPDALRMPTCDCILLACSLTTLSGQSFSQAPHATTAHAHLQQAHSAAKGKFSAQPHLLPLRMHHNNFRSHELRPHASPRVYC